MQVLSAKRREREENYLERYLRGCSGCQNRTQLCNVLQANTKIIQNHSPATLKTEELHFNLLQAKSRCSLKKEEMINLVENNRTLPKPLLTDHRVLEPPLERVSVAVNTLLSQSNYLSLRTTYPTGRFSKNGWLNKHNRHVALLKAKSNRSTVIIGDSIAAGLMRYRNVWDQNFCRDTVNCGIGGDKTQNVLWRSNNFPLTQSLKCH